MRKRLGLTRLVDRAKPIANGSDTWQTLTAEADERAKEARRQGWQLRKRMIAGRTRRASGGGEV